MKCFIVQINIKSWGPGTIPDENVIVLDIEKGSVNSLTKAP
ncbi:MAG: hypothetical protein ABR980_03565 [Ignavibacteriaceae bacterium]